MAAKTYWLDPDNTALAVADTGAEATTASGWTVAKVAPTVYSYLVSGVERISSTFGATVQPDGVTGDTASLIAGGIGTPDLLTGTFDAGVWTPTMKAIAVTAGGTQDGSLRFRIFKCNSALTVFTELTSGGIDCGVVTNLAVGTAQASSGATGSIGPFTFTNEAVVLQLGWKITGAGGANGCDVLLRKGTGITLVTPNFTASGGGSTYTKAGYGKEHG